MSSLIFVSDAFAFMATRLLHQIESESKPPVPMQPRPHCINLRLTDLPPRDKLPLLPTIDAKVDAKISVENGSLLNNSRVRGRKNIRQGKKCDLELDPGLGPA